MPHFRTYARLTPLLLVLTACPFGPTDDAFDPTSPEAIAGVWQYLVPNEFETTLEFRLDGSFTVVEANLVERRCETVRGTWSAEAGVLSVTVTSRDDRVVSESESIGYALSETAIDVVYDDGDTETWSLVDTMRSCDDYGWWSATMSAVIEGTRYDFQVHFDEAGVEGDLASRSFAFGGWAEVPGGDATACVTCKVLELEFLNESGPLVAGTYTTRGSSSGESLWGVATYRPSYSGSDESYRTDENFDAPGEPTGTIVVTSLGSNVIEGTFSLTLYNGRAQPPFPTVSIADGRFRFWKN